MDTCSVETGFLRKKPCGTAAVAKCASCEQPLCSQHAVAQLNSLGRKTGAFMCQECVAANRQHEKSIAAAPPTVKKPAPPAQGPAAAKPPAPAPGAAAKEAPAEKTGGSQTAGGIDFTPSGNKAPGTGDKKG